MISVPDTYSPCQRKLAQILNGVPLTRGCGGLALSGVPTWKQADHTLATALYAVQYRTQRKQASMKQAQP